MKKGLIISVVINILFILFGGYVIHKKGGVDYLKLKLKFKPKQAIIGQEDLRPHYKDLRIYYESLPNDPNEIIFLGNSITAGCCWGELFGSANIKNRGISGDVITGVIYRLDEVVESQPKKIFLMIGINDLARGKPVEQILIEYEKLLILIKEKSPQTELYIQSVLPTDDKAKYKNVDIISINEGLLKLAGKYQLTYVNLFDLFKNGENKLDTAYSFDGLHPNFNGYLLWKKAIENYVNN